MLPYVYIEKEIETAEGHSRVASSCVDIDGEREKKIDISVCII